jgi:tetratricopeptide (TPR) repeat protein
VTLPGGTALYELHHFCGDFASWVKHGVDVRYCFVLGAGASRNSGIPTGATLVDDWLRVRFTQERPDADPAAIAQWAADTFQHWPDFTWPGRAAHYGRIYEWFFRDNAIGQAELRRIMHQKSPSFGYSVLASVLHRTPHKVLITTNFDNLVRDALALHTPDANPFVCHGEKDARFLAGYGERIRIIKLHGDIDRETYNAAAQIERLNSQWEIALRAIFTEYTPIFIGYGGNDVGFMNFLTDLDAEHFRARPIWAYRVESPGGGATLPGQAPPGCPDTPPIQAFMKRHRGLWLPIVGFDELMLVLAHLLGYDSQAARIRADADSRAKEYERTLAESVTAMRKAAETAWAPALIVLADKAAATLLGEHKRRTWDEWRVALEASFSDREKRRLFEHALSELKDCAELRARYAVFLAEQGERARATEEIGQARQLAIDSAGLESPAMLTVRHFEARLLTIDEHFPEARTVAEDVFKKRVALLGPEHPDTLATETILANLLTRTLEYAEAESRHRHVLAVSSRALGEDHELTLRALNNLAVLLRRTSRYEEAERLYRRAIAARIRVSGPTHAATLGSRKNLAICLRHQGRLAEAQRELEEVAAALERVEGVDHPDTLDALEEMAVLLEDTGHFAEADQKWNQVESSHKRSGRTHDVDRVQHRRQEAAERRNPPAAAIGDAALGPSAAENSGARVPSPAA